MLLNAARLPARTDAEGNLLLLEDQDRSRWDHEMIARGMRHLAESASGNAAGAYHLQAGIAGLPLRGARLRLDRLAAHSSPSTTSCRNSTPRP